MQIACQVCGGAAYSHVDGEFLCTRCWLWFSRAVLRWFPLLGTQGPLRG